MMSDWLSFLLLVSGSFGLLLVYFINRYAKIAAQNKKPSQLTQKITQILYFNTSDEEFLRNAQEFDTKPLTRFFCQLFIQHKKQESYTATLRSLFAKLNLIEANINEFNQANQDDKMEMLDDFKVLPVPEISQLLLSYLYKPIPDLLMIKILKALSSQKIFDAFPLFLKKTITLPKEFDDDIVEIVSSYQADFPDSFLGKQTNRLQGNEANIENRFTSFLESDDPIKIKVGCYVFGYLSQNNSPIKILHAIQSPAGRKKLHVACTALKKFSQDTFLPELLMWFFSTEDWSSEEIQDLLSVFSRFYPVGETFLKRLTEHPQLLVQISAQAALRQNQI